MLTRINIPIMREVGLGAEARLYESEYLGNKVMCKERLVKSFRLQAIDEKLRKERTTQEVRLLKQARENGINVPLVYDVDKASWTIVMEKVDGTPVKQAIPSPEQISLFNKIGVQVGRIHLQDIIHGDLTTSNLMIGSDDNLWLIDFGLGFVSNQLEDKAVDILVLKHTLESSHPAEYATCFNEFTRSYFNTYEDAKRVFKRMDIVENRVRYKSH